MNPNPPSIPRFILCLFRDKIEHESLIGDCDEMFRIQYSSDSPVRARFWYWLQVFKALPSFIINNIYWSFVMINNYLKIAMRNIKKHVGYSFINVTGLAIGMACSILILLYVNYELSFDKFHKKADRIHRLAVRASIGDTKINQTFSSAITFKKLLEDFPEIETGVKFLGIDQVPVMLEDRTFYESRIFAVDSVFFDIFTFPLIQGDPKTALTRPKTMVVSQKTAMKYFRDTDVVGRVLTVDLTSWDLGKIDYEITAVSENVPDNSHFHYDILVSSESFPSIINNTGWTANNFISYIVLKPGTSKIELEEKLKDFTRKYMGGERFDAWVAKGNFWKYFFQPITEIHLNSDLNGEFEANGNETYVYIFSIISVIILLIACLGLFGLASFTADRKTKEIGIRKVMGFSLEYCSAFFQRIHQMGVIGKHHCLAG